MNETPIKNKNNYEDLKPYQARDLYGIGGWLIVMLIGFILNIGDSAYTLIQIILINPFALLMIFLNLADMLLYIFLLIIMLKKIHFFPKLYFIIIIVSTALLFLAELFVSFSFDFLTVVLVLIAIAWLIYLKKSKRVYNTFIYDWKGEIIIKHNIDEPAELEF